MAEKRRVTIEDVARKAGVSTMTISRVLNNKREISPTTRERVLEVIEELGYRPSRVARSLATNQTFIIGVIVPDITNPFFAEIVRGIEDAAWEKDYNILLCNTVENQRREEAALRLLEDTQADGLIMCSPRLPEAKLVPLLEQHQAAILFNRPVHTERVRMVWVDDEGGACQATEFLISLGRQRLGFLAGPVRSASSRARRRGVLRAVEAAGTEVHLELQLPCPPTWEGGYQAALKLLATHPQVDGLICYNDMVAVGALQACSEQGRSIPGEMAMIGFDNILLARVIEPSLTTMHIDKYGVGRCLMQALLEQIQADGKHSEIVIRPELIVRNSTP